MDNNQQERIHPIIIDGFIKTLMPFFSWLLCRISLAMFGVRLTLVLLHPTTMWRSRVSDTWVKNNQLFSCTEILGFQTASHRRLARKKLKRIMRPFLRQMNRSQECLLVRRLFLEKLKRLEDTYEEIPHKIRLEIDMEEAENRENKRLTAYSRDDVLETFPVGETLEASVTKRVAREIDGYPETVLSLLWEASWDWSLLRGIEIRENSKIWQILGFHPNDEPDLEQLTNFFLDFALSRLDEHKSMYLARWFMDRILVSQFISYPHSDKRLASLETPIGEDIALKDTIADERAQETFYRIEDLEVLSKVLKELPAAQREAAHLSLQTRDTEVLRRQLGEKKYKALQRNFERAARRLRDLRESGRLPT